MASVVVFLVARARRDGGEMRLSAYSIYLRGGVSYLCGIDVQMDIFICARWVAAPAGIATCQAFADRPTTITDSLSVYISYVMSQERIYPRSLARGRLDSF